jgi:hypothetical protein
MSKRKKHKTGVVHSSGGDITIDLVNGKVLSFELDGEDPEYREVFENIRNFDLKEYVEHYPDEAGETQFDILDLGYWLKDGYYEPPEPDFRENVASGGELL